LPKKPVKKVGPAPRKAASKVRSANAAEKRVMDNKTKKQQSTRVTSNIPSAPFIPGGLPKRSRGYLTTNKNPYTPVYVNGKKYDALEGVTNPNPPGKSTRGKKKK
jgi:hypothetical protein